MCLRVGWESVRKGTNRSEHPSAREKSRPDWKKDLQIWVREENHEKGPRRSWARTQMGKIN